MSRHTLSEDGAPIDRTVQLTGNATFVVSLPKEWATEQNLDAGSTMYLYPHDDRIVAAPARLSERERSVTIDTGTDDRPIDRRVRDAYVTGADRIEVQNAAALGESERRSLERSVRQLIGIEIVESTADRFTVRNLLDAGEWSLPQTLAQLRQHALELPTDAVDAVTTPDEDLARRVGDRAADVDRLAAFIHRGFHRGLEDVREINRLDTDRTAALCASRTARELTRIATHTDRIATVAGRQSTPPGGDFPRRLEEVADDVRDVVELAVADEPAAAIDARERLREPLERLDRACYGCGDADAPLYGTVACRLERIADCGVAIADTGVETDLGS